MTPPPLTGRCHCGGVTFDLARARGSVYCHCSICRRTSGAPFIAAVTVKPNDAEVRCADGVELTPYASSSYLTRHRCSRCGAAIFNAIRMESGLAFDNFMVALVDNAQAPHPTHHIYYAERILDLDDGLPKFDAFGMP